LYSSKRDHLAVDHRFVGQVGEGLDYCRTLAVEALVVPRPQVRYAVGFEGERSISVELQLVEPVRTFGKSLGVKEQHRLDEAHFDI